MKVLDKPEIPTSIYTLKDANNQRSRCLSSDQTFEFLSNLNPNLITGKQDICNKNLLKIQSPSNLLSANSSREKKRRENKIKVLKTVLKKDINNLKVKNYMSDKDDESLFSILNSPTELCSKSNFTKISTRNQMTSMREKQLKLTFIQDFKVDPMLCEIERKCLSPGIKERPTFVINNNPSRFKSPLLNRQKKSNNIATTIDFIVPNKNFMNRIQSPQQNKERIQIKKRRNLGTKTIEEQTYTNTRRKRNKEFKFCAEYIMY